MSDKSIILIIDDDSTARTALEMLLKPDGYVLAFAENGVEGLSKARELLPDLILLDVMMPGMHGFDVCRALRQDPQLAELPVLMVTALDDRASRLEGLEAGADDIISKPYDRAELRARIRTIARLNRYRRLLETEEQLARLANYDTVTDLPNRNLLHELLLQTVVRAERQNEVFALIHIDIDNFKQINENLGSGQGDLLLRKVAQRLLNCSEKGDTVARLASDEFVILLGSIDTLREQDIGHSAQQFLEVISMPLLLGQHELIMTASAGIALYPNDATTPENLLKLASVAMSRAKSLGKGKYQFYTVQMNATAMERLILENQLRKTLARDELCVYYQPQIGLENGKVVAVEALLRWQHPDGHLVPPGEFIPIAEEIGLIASIGTWVLSTACKQAKQWQAQGLPELRLAVNVSSMQFQQIDWVSTVKHILQETQFPPQQLELELTESLFLQKEINGIKPWAMLEEFRQIGVRIALDDFGTGYSSLSYLKRFRVDTLKIDQSFIREVAEDLDDAALVSAIIAMAHSLRLEVTAEGVETEKQLDFLRRHHCDYVQGFYFSKPIPEQGLSECIQSCEEKLMGNS